MGPAGKRSVTIIGAGNWLILHDCVGPRVLELIRGRYGPEVEICESACTGLSLLDHLHGQDLLIVVDAGLFGGYPGQIREIGKEEGFRSCTCPGHAASIHQIGPFEALYVARKLYPNWLPRQLVSIIVETRDIDSEILQTACRRVAVIIDGYIRGRRQIP